MIWTKQAYLFDVDLWLKGDNPDWPPPASRESHPQPALETPEHDAGDDGLRQVGMPLVRGLGPRVPVHPVRPRRPRLRQESALGACCSNSSSTPTARSRPTSGNSPTSTRRSMPGPSGVCLQHGPHPLRQGGPGVAGALLPQADAQLHLVGEQGRQGRATTSSKAASSGSTTSRSWIAPGGATTVRRSSSRTRPGGWGCSA